MNSLIPRAMAITRWESASSEVSKALSQRIVLAFLGSASSGKDSAIKALFGMDFGEVSPIPGSTDKVRIAPLDDGRVLVANAPGFGDIRASVDQAARQVLDHVDLTVYVVNCEGGATIDERRDLDAIRAMGRPVLVALNKIDLIRPHQREAFIEATLEQLGVDRSDAVVTAFDPLPALSKEPLGVAETTEWIFRTLDKQGKALLFAKQLRNKAAACEPIIKSAAKAAMAAGAIPVPGADITAVTAVQVKLITDIAAVHGEEIGKDLVLFIIGEALAGTSKGFIRWAVRALKGAGWIPGAQLAHLATSALGASVAGASTYGVGQAAVVFIQRGKDLTPDQLREVFDAAAFAYRERASTDDEDIVDVEVIED
ncbi:MAG: DUF697 domain-containing protein [Proteobacteria bacterium]|nr:DUF697 domain-containing protein [Pseudomonadota bacterium]